MKRTRYIAIASALVLMLIATAVLWWKPSPKLPSPTAPHATATVLPPPAVASSTPQSAPADEPKQLPGGPFEPRDRRWQWWNQMKKEDRNFEWKMPLAFYGKVVDERGQPVPGAKIEFSWTDLSLKGTSQAQTTSGSDGRFSLTKQRGKRLEVRVSKDGYFRSQEQSSGNFEYAAFFEPSFHQPDPDAPVIFHLKKKGVPEPLVTWRKLLGFPIDGSAIYLDLMTGRTSKTPKGQDDLIIRTERPADVRGQFDWSLVIEGVNGAGVVESKDELMFEAPVDGYQPRIEYAGSAGEPGWRAELQKRFFVRSRAGGLHALLNANVLAVYNEQAAINMDVAVNPSGSRNLEPGGPKQASAP